MTAKPMTLKVMTAERMTQQGCDDQRSWMTIYD
jgi:hypothetical protein